jgi:hypothetical protein
VGGRASPRGARLGVGLALTASCTAAEPPTGWWWVGCDAVVEDVCYARDDADIRVLVAYADAPGTDAEVPLAGTRVRSVGPGTTSTPFAQLVRRSGEAPESPSRAHGRAMHAALLAGDVGAATASLDALRRLPTRAVEDALRELGGEGALASAVGDVRGAVRAWRRRESLASALQLSAYVGFPYLADALQRAGEHLAALDAYEHAIVTLRAVGDDTTACRLHGLGISLAFGMHRAEMAGVDVDAWRHDHASADASALLDAAGAAWPEGCPEDALRRQAWSVDRAMVALALGDLATVEAHILTWDAAPASAAVALDRERVRAGVAQRQGHWAEAELAWRRMEALAVVADPVQGRMDALEGRALALRALGKGAEGRRVGWEALETAEAFAPFVPLDGGRDRFLSGLTRVVGALAEAHLDAGDAAGALRAWRTHRRAFLASVRDGVQPHDPAFVAAVARYRGLVARGDDVLANAWKLSARDLDRQQARVAAWLREGRALLEAALPRAAERTPLPEVATGEALVLWTGLASEDRAFVRRPDGTVVAVALAGGPVPPSLVDAVRGAARIRLLVPPTDADRDLPLLGLPGARLIDVAPVAWSLDLGPRAPVAGEGAALVVDPTGDLPGARREGEGVLAAWAASGWRAVRLAGAEATASAVRPLWASVARLHHAGHGESGEGPWGASLRLADDTRVGVADVLAGGRSPARVVLSGCETASAPGTAVANLGMAQAFVLVGAEAVVAATRPVDDAATATFMDALYAARWTDGDPWVAFRAAAAPGFRLMVP